MEEEKTATTEPTATGAEGATPPTDGGQGQTGGQGQGAAETGTDPQPKEPTATGDDPAPGADKPFLGGAPKNKDVNNVDKPVDKPGDKSETPSEDDYLKAVTKDENVLGKDNSLEFDQRLVKSVIPVCQKHGVKPEVVRELANAFAKAQLDGAKEAFKERAAYFEKMNGAAREKYSDDDFAQINRGIDACFKPGGVMNNVIRNSELGADPEFLALMHRLGAEVKEDTGKGAASGAGEGSGDPNGIQGLSKLW